MMVAITGLGFGMPVSSAHYYGCTATNIHVTPKWVEASGYNSSGGYYWCTGKFKNYNPVTHHWGVLRWNPKHTAEVNGLLLMTIWTLVSMVDVKD